jgi:molecular chaperone DnaK
MKEYIIGIDLGTTFSAISVVESGEPTIIPSSEGNNTIPSVVSWKKDGERVVGTVAKRSAVTNPKNTIFSAKRLMGHKYSEVKDEVSKVPYTIKENDKGMAVVDVPALGKMLTPEEISAAILQKCKADAEAYLGQQVTKAVITVPAYFDDSQRQATKNAGEIAGLEVLRIINEPTAAALAYGLDKQKDEKVLIFDLGGGTFDVSILDIGEGTFEVLSSNGDSRLGGDDFDEQITNYVCDEFKKEQGIDLKKDPSALSRIKEASEKAKIELSSQLSTSINLPYISSVDNQPVHLNIDITRTKFESLIKDLLKRIEAPIMTALKDGVNGDKSKIQEVILVGGSSRIPCVQTLIKDIIGLEPNKSVSADLAIAYGAAVQGAILAGDVKDIVLLDVAPLSLGVEVNGGMVDILIPKNTTIPTQKKNIYTTAVANQDSVTINCLQGERPLAKDNKSLGMFNLTGIAPAPARVPQIEVSFDINANGILSVNAKDLGTGKEQKITISNSSNLDKDEIERMIKEAEEYKEADEEAKNTILDKNELEMLVGNMKTTCEEAKDKVDESLITPVLEAITQAEDALKDGSKEKIEEAKNNLISSSHALTSKLYENVQNTATEEVVEEPPTEVVE